MDRETFYCTVLRRILNKIKVSNVEYRQAVSFDDEVGRFFEENYVDNDIDKLVADISTWLTKKGPVLKIWSSKQPVEQ